MYGSAGSLSSLPPSLPSRHSHPTLDNLEVSLFPDGAVEYSAPDWKVKLAPINFSLSSPSHVYKGEGLQLLRGEDGETGLSFDGKSSRHLFLFGTTPPSELSLQLEVCLLLFMESSLTCLL